MTSEHKYGLVRHDFARKDSIARVTGREVYSVDVSLPACFTAGSWAVPTLTRS